MSYVEIPLWKVAVAALLVALAIALSHRAALKLEKTLAIGAVRAAIQLVAIGYALELIFAADRPWVVFAALGVMSVVAAWTAARRVSKGPSTRVLFPRALAAVLAGGVVSLAPVLLFVIAPSPWYEARYFIPIAGMMLSSAMNAVALVFDRVFGSARDARGAIEQMLALGASPGQALRPTVQAALRAAMLPTLNALVTVGLVALPGMMTGQIVSGTSPAQAVRYQIVIMYQLVAVTAVAGFAAASFATRLLFTPDAQLREAA